jgi:hypothetical protein
MDINKFFAELNGLTFENMVKAVNVAQEAKQNLFSANHRGQMIAKYDYTEAMRIKIEDLI